MAFGAWFSMWVNSIFKLLTVNSRKKRSKSQRRKEHEWRLKATRFGASRYRVKKYRRKRRSSYTMRNLRFISALFRCIAVTLGVLLLPIGLLHAGGKRARAQGKKTETPHAAPVSMTERTQTSLNEKKKEKSSVEASPPVKTEKSFVCDLPNERWASPSPKIDGTREETYSAANELTPKSKPKNEKDQYIRKRMIFTAATPSRKEALGAYLDVVLEADAVRLVLEGEAVGCISSMDKAPFAAALRLDRKIYAVITERFEDNGTLKYEFEAWFSDR